MSNNRGFIYLVHRQNCYPRIRQNTSVPVKIGRSINPIERVINLQVGNHENLMISAAFKVDNYKRQETLIHNKLKDKKIRGEWYNLNMDDIERIWNLCGRPEPELVRFIPISYHKYLKFLAKQHPLYVHYNRKNKDDE